MYHGSSTRTDIDFQYASECEMESHPDTTYRAQIEFPRVPEGVTVVVESDSPEGIKSAIVDFQIS